MSEARPLGFLYTETPDEFVELSSAAGRLSKLLDVVTRDAEKLILECGIKPIYPSRKDKRESEDSQKTAVAISLSLTDSEPPTPTKSSRPPTPSDIPPLDVSPSEKKRPSGRGGKSRTASKWKAWFKAPMLCGIAINNVLRTASAVLVAIQRDLNGNAEAIACLSPAHPKLKVYLAGSVHHTKNKPIDYSCGKDYLMISGYRQALEENQGGVSRRVEARRVCRDVKRLCGRII
ncbi:uncharacterized protein EV420DRAFT_1741924 [Desarmillaria tabescens]|uniref:Uncharacterized protein n=1 Tax=Armillaria tabescens TaxID=1929756 RepID=A0AA39U850_ARMTA|nr:uncharacterized protein EV420DRAFT_1741924 [Desarmillaria tabescens]KAK0469140.1 hypothetical protein EV420DRAFT_1741924 [Desarmillaria tabescens]